MRSSWINQVYLSIWHPFIIGPNTLSIFFICCVIEALAFGGLTEKWRDRHPQGNLIPKDDNNSPEIIPFTCKPILSLQPQPPPYPTHTPSQYFRCPKSSGPGARHLGTIL